ncbi:MAG: response regulator [Prosthecobacter sp.]|nr:response regulator [Prosthecobacter sp.]
MKRETVILIADDDAGHARLIEKNLGRAALSNRIERFEDGQQVLDFLFCRGERRREPDSTYLLLLDIRMPKVDGVEVLRQLKEDPELRRLPIIMLTTTDDPREVQRCHELGCSNYIVKPVDYLQFADAVIKMGSFITLVRVPELNHISE